MGVASARLKKGERPPVPDEKRCTAITTAGKRCACAALKGEKLCHLHTANNAKSAGIKGGKTVGKIWEDYRRRSKLLPVHSWEKLKDFVCGNMHIIIENYEPKAYKAQILLQGWSKLLAKALEAEDKRLGIGSEVTIVMQGWGERPR